MGRPRKEVVSSQGSGADNTTYRRIMRVRKLWFEQRKLWLRSGKPERVEIIEDDENITFHISRRSDGEYIIDCAGFTWID